MEKKQSPKKPVQDDKRQREAKAAAVKTGKQTARIIRRGAKHTWRTTRNFTRLTWDLTKGVIGVGQRRVNRRSNRTTTGRYLNDLITLAETTHLGGQHADLSQVLVEPRFYPHEIFEPVGADDIRQEVYYVIPRTPERPYIMAPYNLKSYRIPELLAGSRRLLIVGTSGSGKTTALMAIALWVLQEVRFDEPDDPVKQMLREEEAALSAKEREERERARQAQSESAQAELEAAIERGEVQQSRAVNAAEAAEEDEESEKLLPVTSLLPLIVHCADLNLNSHEFSGEVDPAEPIVRAVQRRVSTLTARTIPRVVYERLNQDRVLLMMDGYDDLPPAEQQRFRTWYRAFLKQYGKNFIVMTSQLKGYGHLTQMGMTHVYMKPWNRREVQQFVEQWAAAFPQVRGTSRHPGEEIKPSQIKRALTNSYAHSPAELVIRVWGAFSTEDMQPDFEAWIDAYMADHTPRGMALDDPEVVQVLQLAGALQIDLGFVNRRGLEALVGQQESSGSGAISQDTLDELEHEQEEALETGDDGEVTDGSTDAELAQQEAEDEAFDQESEAAAKRGRILRDLVFSGVLVSYRGGRYQFRHALLAHYFGSLTLQELPERDPETLYQLALDERWNPAFAFAAMHTSLDQVVEMRFNANPDISRSELISMADWLAYAKTTSGWQEKLIKRLGNTFVHPRQFSANREAIAAALVASRHPGAALQIFEYAIDQGEIPDVRRLGCLGLGAIGHHGRKHQETLERLCVTESPEIGLAAIHALAGLETDEAKEALAEMFISTDERRQQAAAESFAAMPEDGYPTLYDAVTNHGELTVRRVAAFGLRRIETEWARDLIRTRFLEEDEWYARVVAQDAYLENVAGLKGPQPTPDPSEFEWIQAWARGRGRALTGGKESIRTLALALEDSDPEIRWMAALVMGQMGIVQVIKPLYGKLTDPDQQVRDAAHRALVNLQMRMGKTIADPT